jgi:Na+/melibiose symporter-like transporter
MTVTQIESKKDPYLRYGASNFAKNLLWVIQEIWLLFVFVKVYYFSPIDAGICFLLLLTFSAMADIVWAFILKSIKLSCWHSRIALLVMMPVCSIISVFSFGFQNQSELSFTIFITSIILFRFFYSLLDVLHTELMLGLSPITGPSLLLASWRQIGGTGAMVTIGLIGYSLNPLGIKSDFNGSIRWLAILSSIIATIVFFVTLPQRTEKETISEAADIVFSTDKPDLWGIAYYILFSALSVISAGLFSKSLPFLATLRGWEGGGANVGIVAFAVGRALAIPVMFKYGGTYLTREITAWLYLAVGIIAITIPFMHISILLFFTISMIVGFFTSLGYILSWALLPYLAISTNNELPHEGDLFNNISLFLASIKVSNGLSGPLIGYLIAASQYTSAELKASYSVIYLEAAIALFIIANSLICGVLVKLWNARQGHRIISVEPQPD